MSQMNSGKVMAGNAKVIGKAGVAGGKQMAGNAKAVVNSAAKPVTAPVKLAIGNAKAVGVTALKGPALVQGVQPKPAKTFQHGLKPDNKLMRAQGEAKSAVVSRDFAAAKKNFPAKQAAMVDKVMAMDKVKKTEQQIANRETKNPSLGSRPLPQGPIQKPKTPFKPGAKGNEVPDGFKGAITRADLNKKPANLPTKINNSPPKKAFDPEENGGWPSLED